MGSKKYAYLHKISTGDSLHYAIAAVRIFDLFTVIRSCCINGNSYAAKIITDKRNKQTMNVFNDEVKILSEINHENLIKLYGIDDNSTVFLNKLQLVMEIAAGMKYLEQKQIVHGHLSPQCVLIDQNKMVKLHHHEDIFITRNFVINKWSNKSDVWSFAATWEIFNDYTMIPFAKLTNAQLLENAKHIFSGHNAHNSHTRKVSRIYLNCQTLQQYKYHMISYD
uniref:Protein kinase domain-containing protein n=1 Tax=Wuchereria bancrofti TaxID=6293 RepID=A0A1I8EZK0_WUCBA